MTKMATCTKLIGCIIEPQHDKINKVIVDPAKTLIRLGGCQG